MSIGKDADASYRVLNGPADGPHRSGRHLAAMQDVERASHPALRLSAVNHPKVLDDLKGVLAP